MAMQLSAKDTDPIVYKGASVEWDGESTYRNSAVLFSNHVRTILSAYEGGYWTMPTDAYMTSTPAEPLADQYTEQRRDLLVRVIAPTSATYMDMTNKGNAAVKVQLITGDELKVPFGDITALELLRKVVAEEVRTDPTHAQTALDNVKLLQNESNAAAAHRLVPLTMASIVTPSTLPLAEEKYLRRGISETFILELCGRPHRLVIPETMHQLVSITLLQTPNIDLEETMSLHPVNLSNPTGDEMLPRVEETYRIFN